MSVLNANVVLTDKVTGDRVVLAAGAEPPKEYADQLGAHLFGGDPDDKGSKTTPKTRSK